MFRFELPNEQLEKRKSRPKFDRFLATSSRTMQVNANANNV